MQHLGIPFLLKMQHEVLFFFSPHFIGDTLNTKAECFERLFNFQKIFALRSMGIQLVPSPHMNGTTFDILEIN